MTINRPFGLYYDPTTTPLYILAMLGGWFADRTYASDGKPGAIHNDQSTVQSVISRSGRSSPVPLSQQDSSPYTESVQSKPNEAPTVATPHDAIVNEMNERVREIELAGPSTRVPQSNPDGDGGNSLAGREQTKTRSRMPDNFYDPFTGHSIGNYTHDDFTESEDDLWAHLIRIRHLQCDIAVMHSQMEGLGTTDRSLRVEQSFGDDEAMNFEEDAKEAKKEEFKKLADRFSGRKEAIDAIMNKLEKLSHAINDFHSTREPVFRVRSRGSTVSEQDPGKGKGVPFAGAKTDRREPPQTPTRILHDDMSLKETPESMARSLEPT